MVSFVAKQIGYGNDLPDGSGIGLASHITFGGYAAQAMHVSIEQGRLTIERAVAAMACGLVVYPKAVEAHSLR